ncbi:hypothetical protein [Arthrobacter ulcerisalmonis]|uniref:hypothetical protein n=1 Tax=Arthrobacter ulcerisalmonis TaxID=2483813 RepID=UPI003640353A
MTLFASSLLRFSAQQLGHLLGQQPTAIGGRAILGGVVAIARLVLEVLAASAGHVQQLVNPRAQLSVDRDDAPAAVDDQAQGSAIPATCIA